MHTRHLSLSQVEDQKNVVQDMAKTVHYDLTSPMQCQNSLSLLCERFYGHGAGSCSKRLSYCVYQDVSPHVLILVGARSQPSLQLLRLLTHPPLRGFLYEVFYCKPFRSNFSGAVQQDQQQERMVFHTIWTSMALSPCCCPYCCLYSPACATSTALFTTLSLVLECVWRPYIGQRARHCRWALARVLGKIPF